MDEKKKKTVKKIRLVIIVVIVFMVPLAVMGYKLWLDSNANLKDGTITAVTVAELSSENQESWDLTNADDITFFKNVVTSGSPIDREETHEYRHIKLTFHKLKRDISYELLLADSVIDCLYIDPYGTLNLLPETVAHELLIHPRITALAMSYAAPPTCALATGGEEETPTGTYHGEWVYAKVDGTLTTLTVAETGEKAAALPADPQNGASPAFTFSLEPDFCRVRILNEKGEMLYSGAPEEMEPLFYEEDTPLQVTVFAEWHESEQKNYHGSLEYEFDMLYDVPTQVTLVNREAHPGEAFEIRIAHSSAAEVGVTATFQKGDVTCLRQGRELVISVPVAEEVAPGAYSILLQGGADVDTGLEVLVLAPEA